MSSTCPLSVNYSHRPRTYVSWRSNVMSRPWALFGLEIKLLQPASNLPDRVVEHKEMHFFRSEWKRYTHMGEKLIFSLCTCALNKWRGFPATTVKHFICCVVTIINNNYFCLILHMNLHTHYFYLHSFSLSHTQTPTPPVSAHTPAWSAPLLW